MTCLSHPTLLFLLFTLFLSVHAQNDRVEKLRQCLGSGIPVYTPKQKDFIRMQAASFRSDYVMPLAITQPINELQVSKVVACANKVAFRVCARSGGHSLIGHSQCKGLLIDLIKLNKIYMQPGNIAYVEPAVLNGQALWTLKQSNRWIAAGVCPSVGVGGYILGGGHGPYEGTLGLACNSIVSLRMVDRFGKVLQVSRSQRPFLFWGMCGAGGGQFGIVTAFRLRTASSKIYDRAVVYRFRWPALYGGEVLEKWQNYDEFGGKVWFRFEIYLGTSEKGVFGYGACYDVSNVQECMQRLKKAPFFNVPGRTTTHISKANDALDVHAFFGPEGGWGRKRAPNVKNALLYQRGKEFGDANGRLYQSTFLSKPKVHPSRAFWQRYVDYCQKPDGVTTIPWVVCEMNLFNNAIDRQAPTAFPYRHANIITHYIIGGGSQKDKNSAYYWMKGHLAKFTLGVYVNYPELLLKNYATAYWGQNLGALKKLKKTYDPFYMFMNPQPIPN